MDRNGDSDLLLQDHGGDTGSRFRVKADVLDDEHDAVQETESGVARAHKLLEFIQDFHKREDFVSTFPTVRTPPMMDSPMLLLSPTRSRIDCTV